MLGNVWNRVVDWFRDRNARGRLLRSFNEAARDAFVCGMVPTLLKASFSRGDRLYRHQFSDWLNSGFRIKAYNGRQLSRDELVSIGTAIMSDSVLIRKLVVLGFDTLEVQRDVGAYGCKWRLSDYLMLNQ